MACLPARNCKIRLQDWDGQLQVHCNMSGFANIEIWSRKIDRVVLAAFLVVVTGTWVVYKWGWPAYQWHFVTKPRLISSLAEIGGPTLESLKLNDRGLFEFQIEHGGVSIGSPVKIEDVGYAVKGAGFSIRFSEHSPDIRKRSTNRCG